MRRGPSAVGGVPVPAEAGSEPYGLGLGLFIAKTLLERTGARLVFANLDPPGSGASVRITWPRAAIEAEPAEIDAAHLGVAAANTYKTGVEAG